eukprot:scaffold35418_cov101-Isochrysis_galbana.AAC.1
MPYLLEWVWLGEGREVVGRARGVREERILEISVWGEVSFTALRSTAFGGWLYRMWTGARARCAYGAGSLTCAMEE